MISRLWGTRQGREIPQLQYLPGIGILTAAVFIGEFKIAVSASVHRDEKYRNCSICQG